MLYWETGKNPLGSFVVKLHIDKYNTDKMISQILIPIHKPFPLIFWVLLLLPGADCYFLLLLCPEIEENWCSSLSSLMLPLLFFNINAYVGQDCSRISKQKEKTKSCFYLGGLSLSKGSFCSGRTELLLFCSASCATDVMDWSWQFHVGINFFFP